MEGECSQRVLITWILPVFLLHVRAFPTGEERLTNDVAAREQLVAPGATNGWFIIGTSAPPPPPGSLPGRPAGAAQWRPPGCVSGSGA